MIFCFLNDSLYGNWLHMFKIILENNDFSTSIIILLMQSLINALWFCLPLFGIAWHDSGCISCLVYLPYYKA